MACEKLHNARAIVQDLENPAVGQAVFERFNGGRDGTLAYYHSLAHVFATRDVAVATAFDNAVGRMHELAGNAPRLTLRMLGDSYSERAVGRSEEHKSALQSLMRISYAVVCLKT